jgi:serine/threonine-protein kinase
MAPATGREDEYGAPQPRDGRPWLWWALGAVVLAAVVVAALLLLLPGTSHVTVPDVGGQSEQSAGATLRHLGLNPVPSLASSTTVPTGLVMSQTPAAGSVGEKGSRVAIVVSGGPASAALMSVEGLSAAAALTRLRAAGFRPTTKSLASSTVPAGKVIGTEPPAGTETQLGFHVVVLVSSGPAPVRVPDVTGQPLAGAEATLTNAGLAVGTVTKQTSTTQSPGIVLAQSPSTGTLLHTGEKVELTVAQAPTEVAVPTVVGKSEALAAAALGEAGLKPKTVSATTTEPAQVGVVLTQAPAAGAHARKGATVTIGVGVLGTPTTPTTTTPTTPTTPGASVPPATG